MRLWSAIRSIRIAWLCLALPLTVSGQTRPPEGRLNFVSCPIVRDTQTVPCWLSAYEGELYYLGIQTDVSAEFDPPFLGHRVLVEGVVADGAERICGGIVLDPVRVSPMPELDARCNQILPAEDRYTVPFAPRPPGPSAGRLAFAPAPGVPMAQAESADLSLPHEFILYYDFDTLIVGRLGGVLADVLGFVHESEAGRIEIQGFAGATLLSDGTRLEEPAGIGFKRASEVAKLLRDAGLASADVNVLGEGAPSLPDGVEDWRTRRVVVTVRH